MIQTLFTLSMQDIPIFYSFNNERVSNGFSL